MFGETILFQILYGISLFFELSLKKIFKVALFKGVGEDFSDLYFSEKLLDPLKY